MKVVFLEEAEEELRAASTYYEAQREGLGLEFISTVQTVIDEIPQYPSGWPILFGDVRHRILHRFPYYVVYLMEHETITVVAIMHERRRPGYWKDRLR